MSDSLTRLRTCLAIARVSHWNKNVLVFPGTFAAILLTTNRTDNVLWNVPLGFVVACLLASANYVVNEHVDAASDKHHPDKKDRPQVRDPLPVRWVCLEYLTLLGTGLVAAASISSAFFAVAVVFVVMGIAYNVRPVRLKDVAYLDVLCESFNNPIRLLFGWLTVTNDFLPPLSLILAYWSAGGFLMAMKRCAEYRFIDNEARARLYRRSFERYTENKLLVCSFIYACASTFLFGIFMTKYRIELVLGAPFIALLFGWYLHIGLERPSSVQHPEHLHKEARFMMAVFFVIFLLMFLATTDLPVLQQLLDPDLRSIGG